MTLTNKFDLPEPYVKAFGFDPYERGNADHTATELVQPVRIRAFSEKFDAQRVEDISDRVWAFWGQANHEVLARIASQDPNRYLVEERFEHTMPGGATVSGKIDLFDRNTRILYDHKETSVWKFILGDMDEWEQQANINLFLMRMAGFDVKDLINVAKLKDWKARLARTTKRRDYPQCAIHIVPMRMWTIGEAQDFILKRAAAHHDQKASPPVCTKKERWQRDPCFAVMRKGRKTALKLCDDYDRALGVMRFYEEHRKPGEAFFIEERQTEPVRCLDFCPVQEFCDYGIEAVRKWREKEEAKNE